MQPVLIDTFIVPEHASDLFLERARSIQAFIKTLPGFVEGYLHKKQAGENRYNFITCAVWASEEAFANAREAVAAEFARRDINPQAFQETHGIHLERAIYQRVPY